MNGHQVLSSILLAFWRIYPNFYCHQRAQSKLLEAFIGKQHLNAKGLLYMSFTQLYGRKYPQRFRLLPQ